MIRTFIAPVAIALLAMLAAPASFAVDADLALTRLQAKEDNVSRALISPPKKGPATLDRLRTLRDAVRAEQARIQRGGAVDLDRLAELTDQPRPEPTGPAALARRAETRVEVLKRRTGPGRKVGLAMREAMREDIDALDTMISALESGRDIDEAALDEMLDLVIARAPLSPAERLAQDKSRLATLKRRLVSGPKIGVARRDALQDEIEALEEDIDRRNI